MRVIRSAILNSIPIVQFGFSTRLGGISPPPLGMNLSFHVGDESANVVKNRELFFGSLEIEITKLALPMQVHGNTLKYIDAPGSYPQCDALITDVQDVFLCVSVADCASVFLLDPTKKVVAAVHSGWRGTAKHLVRDTVQSMVNDSGCTPKDIVAFIGPCASACCYAVGDDVASLFAPEFLKHKENRVFVDLKSANISQLTELGIPDSQIEVSSHCTICQSHLFHSFRRDRERSGRMIGAIGLVGHLD
jgi:polyphenol oxidase